MNESSSENFSSEIQENTLYKRKPRLAGAFFNLQKSIFSGGRRSGTTSFSIFPSFHSLET